MFSVLFYIYLLENDSARTLKNKYDMYINETGLIMFFLILLSGTSEEEEEEEEEKDDEEEVLLPSRFIR